MKPKQSLPRLDTSDETIFVAGTAIIIANCEDGNGKPSSAIAAELCRRANSFPALVEAFKKFGRHFEHCDKRKHDGEQECTCGLDNALAIALSDPAEG